MVCCLTMRIARTVSAIMLVVVSLTPQPAVAEQEAEREAWKAEIAAAAVRAQARREEARAELERRRAERLLNPSLSDDAERARLASEQVRSDSSLRSGDIVSTTDGLFVFVGKDDGERTGADFVLLPPKR
jgi:hypothetical protein